MRFILMTLMLTYIWIWLFTKMVIEKPLIDQHKEDDFRNPHQRHVMQKTISTEVLEKPMYPEHNTLILIWFGTFTYLIADIWRIWLRLIFNLNPVINEDE